jgi:hypothetical protein
LKVYYKFHILIFNVSYKNKNKGQQQKYNKMTCEKMEDQIEILYFKLLKSKI